MNFFIKRFALCFWTKNWQCICHFQNSECKVAISFGHHIDSHPSFHLQKTNIKYSSMIENDEHDEFVLCDESSDVNEKKFAELIGHVEDIVVNENFVGMLEEFLEKAMGQRNLDVDLDLYGNYVTTVKKYIEEQLQKRVKCFEMTVFEEELRRRESEIGSDILELLSSFRNFQAFKQFVLDYREAREKCIDFARAAVSVSHYQL